MEVVRGLLDIQYTACATGHQMYMTPHVLRGSTMAAYTASRTALALHLPCTDLFYVIHACPGLQTYTAIIRNYSSMSREEQEREMLAVKVRGGGGDKSLVKVKRRGRRWGVRRDARAQHRMNLSTASAIAQD